RPGAPVWGPSPAGRYAARCPRARPRSGPPTRRTPEGIGAARARAARACAPSWVASLLDEIHEGEDENPDQVDEVPVEGGDLDLVVVVRAVDRRPPGEQGGDQVDYARAGRGGDDGDETREG